MNDLTTPERPRDIEPVTIEEEMRRSYLDYAMSVIVSRALPDVRDGLKPVHRRILYSMYEQGHTHDKPYRKSARIVGDVMGKYHPHGDQAIYDAMVRMAQDFSMRLPLLDGQGNFGSMDGDPPAAMRYTEIRMGRPAEALLGDIDKATVDFRPTYDDSGQEPSVLPAQIPNLLVNGAGGIAVGMATNVAPHNLGEVIAACLAYIANPDITIPELMDLVPGPDFPTGGIILGRAGIRSAYMTGRGSIVMRGKVHFETLRRDREAIIVSEIPYQVNKSRMIEQIADAVRSKRIEGISELRDESDRHGVRVVVEIKRDAVPEVVLNQLYRFSALQTSFGVNALALTGGRPQLFDIKEMIAAFVAFREEVITRRTKFLLGKARDRAHVLVGLAIAVSNIDEMIALIRGAPDPTTARESMIAREWPASDVESLIRLIDEPGRTVVSGKYRLSETQARAILELRLHRLTALGRDDIGDELKGLGVQIADYLEILASRARVMRIMHDELTDIGKQFANPRRTSIEEAEADYDEEDLIQREEMVVTLSHLGYIKRAPLSNYRTQKRGGKGRTGMATREEDFVSQVFVTNTHTPVLFFSNAGKAYKLKVYKLPLGAPQARGKPLINLLPLGPGETIETLLPLPEDEAEWGELQVMFATSKGNVRRNALSDFANVKANGKIAMKVDDDERIVRVRTCREDEDVILIARNGKCIRFPVSDVRIFKGRGSTGVRGMKLAKGDEVISMSMLRHVELETAEREAYLRYRRQTGEEGEPVENGEAAIAVERAEALAAEEQFLLSITERGFGKRTSAYEYRLAGRGGQGVINIETGSRNGKVVAAFPVEESDQLMLVTDGGQLIRCPVNDIRIAGRGTSGVTVFRTSEEERVVSVSRLRDLAGEPDAEADDGDDAPPIDAVPPEEG